MRARIGYAATDEVAIVNYSRESHAWQQLATLPDSFATLPDSLATLPGCFATLSGLKFYLALVCNYAYNTRNYVRLQLASVIDEGRFLTGSTVAQKPWFDSHDTSSDWCETYCGKGATRKGYVR